MTSWLWTHLLPVLFWAWLLAPGTITPLKDEA